MGLNDLNSKLRKQPQPDKSAAVPVARAGAGGDAPRKSGGKAESGRLQKFAATLATLLTQDDLVAVAEVYRKALKAKRRFWVKTGTDPKTGREIGEWRWEDDLAMQMRAADMIAAYKEGLPTQRHEVLIAAFQGIEETREKIVGSPELTRALRGIGNKVAHGGEVIDIEAENIAPKKADLQ